MKRLGMLSAIVVAGLYGVLAQAGDISATCAMNIMAAADENMGYQRGNTSSWPRLPNELKYFAKLTKRLRNPSKQNAILMDEKSWATVPPQHRPFRGRRLSVVISQNLTENDVPGCVILHRTFEEAMNDLCSEPRLSQIETIWNAGGPEIFKLGLSHPAFKRLYITRITGRYPADAFFPSETDWPRMTKITDPEVPSGIQNENGVSYRFEVYERA